eukprot:10223333-Alexandrium_andersonii.AAC.1
MNLDDRFPENFSASASEVVNVAPGHFGPAQGPSGNPTLDKISEIILRVPLNPGDERDLRSLM